LAVAGGHKSSSHSQSSLGLWPWNERRLEMTHLKITVGEYEFIGRLEEDLAPKTCEAFKKLLPLENKLIHVRWSGQGMWIPFGDLRLGLDYENHTSHPAKGEILIYPGGISEMEIIWAYGRCLFACDMGQLAGNHFLTITEGIEKLPELGNRVLWEGAKSIRIDYL
jgi:hypothetical protein